MGSKEEGWIRYILVSIAVISLLTALNVYVSSELLNKGQADLNESTRWAIFATNAYSSHWVEGSLGYMAREMANAWYEISDYTGNDADLIQAQYWEKIAETKAERAKERFDLYQEKIETGLEPLRESGTLSLEKSSQFTIPIIFFQIASTLLVMTQITKRKELFIFSWGLAAVAIAFLVSIFI